MNRTQRFRTLVPGMVVLLTIGCVGCSGADSAPPAPGDTVAVDPTLPSASTEPDSVGSIPEPILPDTGWTVGTTNVDVTPAGISVLRGVRTAGHNGFDRIVMDFGADAVPGYDIEYIDRPVIQCGSGETVPLAGDAWLRIKFEPANAHTEEGAPTSAPRERRLTLPNLKELELTCDFEAHVEWVAGLAFPTGYRSFVLRSPNRLVVDVRHTR